MQRYRCVTAPSFIAGSTCGVGTARAEVRKKRREMKKDMTERILRYSKFTRNTTKSSSDLDSIIWEYPTDISI